MLVKCNYCSDEFHIYLDTSYEIVIYCAVSICTKMRDLTCQIDFIYFTKDDSELTICI